MTFKLKDIIDLDYIVSRDDALESGADIRLREDKDKKIYRICRQSCRTDEALLLSWLEAKRQEVFRENEKKGLILLPGAVFSSLYAFMVYALIFSGSFSGLTLAWSFLAYHGTRPVNVALFIFLFIVLQVVLIFITVFFLFHRQLKMRSKKSGFRNSMVHTLLSALFFNVLPELLKKINRPRFKKGVDTLEYASALIRMKNREYQALFFLREKRTYKKMPCRSDRICSAGFFGEQALRRCFYRSLQAREKQ